MKNQSIEMELLQCWIHILPNSFILYNVISDVLNQLDQIVLLVHKHVFNLSALGLQRTS